MDKYKYIFVVLVYRNIEVLRDFFQSLHVEDSHVIVVNSYYDDNSLRDCKNEAYSKNADFIPIENKGYGYGNNIGAKYAMDNYEFDYLILSNSDIHITSFDYMNNLSGFSGIIAPLIQMPNGKMQNPNVAWKMPLLFQLLYLSYKYDKIRLWDFAHIMTRLNREFFMLYKRVIRKTKYRIYSCHGAFIIFSADSAKKLYPFFYEEMFLYNEEYYLAERCSRASVPIFFIPKVKVLHLEGASSINNKRIGFDNNKQSYYKFYDFYKKGK